MNCGTVLEKKDIANIYVGLATEAQKQIPSTLQNPRKRVIILAGPTACGKTKFALSLAVAMGGEIISADSMQVYRGMDIGSAKPTFAERQLVPHHLIDIRDINETLNVVDFSYEARNCCQQILERGGVPIVVGGSGFYIHSLIYGPPEGPPPVPEIRQALEIEIEKFGLDVVFERLRQLDPQYAASITKNDKQKIIRALEILTLTGKKVSKLAWTSPKKTQNYDFQCWFLHRPKEHLYRRIDARCEKMISCGFLEEVETLEKAGIKNNSSASQAIGYRQALEYLESNRTPADYEHFLKSFKQASRNYAKRQFTWFRREPLFRWLDMDLHDPEVLLDIIHQEYEAR